MLVVVVLVLVLVFKYFIILRNQMTMAEKGNLSETGLEIAGCRHALAQNAVNMFLGEVYGYAHYLPVNYHITKKVEYFWYDVVCKY